MSAYWPDYKLGQFENSMSRLFDDFLKDLNVERQSGNIVARSNSHSNWIPPLDGVTKEQINLDVRENTLVISGETKRDEKHKEGTLHIHERRYEKFARSVTFPQDIKAADVTAKFEHGVLEVKLPKDESKL
ncbi:11518_t:CDS:2, partial [Racocetra fulgida]